MVSTESSWPGRAASAVVIGALQVGDGTHVAQGVVIRAHAGAVAIGHGAAVLENSVVVGTAAAPVAIGRKAVFGHRCIVIGAAVGDLCEIGNASIVLAGARLGRGCFLGEGTLIAPGVQIPDDSVVVGRPGRVIRTSSADDRARLAVLRGGDLSLPSHPLHSTFGPPRAGATMGQIYAYRDKQPRIDPSAIVFDSAEITGDVVIGPDCIIGAGVKIIGDSHGPVRIGARVQILENTVLHLLPDNTLVVEDDVVIGPGAMIHGCHLGAGTIVEPAAIVCDGSKVGARCVITAGSLVRQRAEHGDDLVLDGFPARPTGAAHPAGPPPWALGRDGVESLRKVR